MKTNWILRTTTIVTASNKTAPFPKTPSLYLLFPSISTANPWKIIVACTTFDTVSKYAFINVSLVVYLSFLLFTAGTIYVHDILDIICDSYFDVKPFLSKISLISNTIIMKLE